MHFPVAPPDVDGVFVKRLNRFLGLFRVDDREELVHIRDPGRLQELLRPGVKIWARGKAKGKAKYYLVAVELEEELVLIDSFIHNKVAAWLIREGAVLRGYVVEKTEPTFNDVRFDLLLRGPRGQKALVEVKGVTLEKDGVALFPDAPTARGARHMEKLASAVERGFEAWALFLVFRKRACTFRPNWELDKRFAEALLRASRRGVNIKAIKLEAYKWGLKPLGELKILLY